MGASISFDSKYKLVLDTEVECISVNPPKAAAASSSASKNNGKRHHSESESGSGSDTGSDNGSDSETGSGSGSDSEHENKIYTVKITSEIASYVRNYLRKDEFLDEFDLITEIDLDKYEYEPGSALVFNSDSIVFNVNNQEIEVVGEWEYLPPEKETQSKQSKSSKSSKKRRGNDDSDDDDNANQHHQSRQFKTKDDELPVSEIENILTQKFAEYNKCHEFVIHESKNSMLCLKINSVEILKA